MSEGSGPLLSVSFSDSQGMQTSKSVLVLTLRQALQRVRRRLPARPCRQLKARCTSEGREAANLVKIFTTIVSIMLLVYHKAEGKRIFPHPLADTDDPSRNNDSHSCLQEKARYISTYRTFYENSLLSPTSRFTDWMRVNIYCRCPLLWVHKLYALIFTSLSSQCWTLKAERCEGLIFSIGFPLGSLHYCYRDALDPWTSPAGQLCCQKPNRDCVGQFPGVNALNYYDYETGGSRNKVQPRGWCQASTVTPFCKTIVSSMVFKGGAFSCLILSILISYWPYLCHN